jgi:hypothetical protein
MGGKILTGKTEVFRENLPLSHLTLDMFHIDWQEKEPRPPR